MASGQMIQQSILKKYGAKPKFRIWRQNTGVAVGWSVFKRAIKKALAGILINVQPTKYGHPGMSDLSGITDGGVRIEIEVKGEGDRESDHQIKWGKMITKFKGIHFVVKSVEDFEREMKCRKLL